VKKDFLKELQDAVTEILESTKTDVSTAERLKAIECGAKLLMIKHRIEGAGEGEDGKFFSKTG
jgi:hypothetical protein